MEKKQRAPGLKARFELENEQERLRRQHNINKPDVVVVERKNIAVNIWTNTLKYIFLSIRICAVISIVTLAIIGLAAVIFPAPRYEMITLWKNTFSELLTLFAL
jgi:hypothetical protein